MKVLLMQPLNEFIFEPPNIPDIGLGYIATALKKEGHTIYVMDWNKKTTSRDFKAWLKENRPDAVGIKVFTKDVGAAIKTISLVREVLPGTVIVIGGPHPSAVDPVELMEDFACCDFAIKGEAEFSFPSLLYEISHKVGNNDEGLLIQESALKIPGLVWRGKERVYSNPIVFIDDLDTIGFPYWELFDPNLYNVPDMLGSALKERAVAPITTTRGCPGKCSFCSAFNVNGRKIRVRSPENVLKEISFLYKNYNVKRFMFQDNCFTAVKENMVRLCELIIKERLQIEWDCVSYERLSNLTNETLSIMYNAGCRLMHMGIESGSLETRKVMNKSCSLEEIAEKVSSIQKNGIKVCAFFMLGFPGETKEDMEITMKYSGSICADIVTFTLCFPLPGSQVYRYLKELYGFDRIDWANFDISTSPYPASRLTSPELAKLLKDIRLRLRIKRIVRKITKVLTMSRGK